MANDQSMHGCIDGTLQCSVTNTAQHIGIQEATQFGFNTTTVEQLAMELLSFDEFYRDNWGVHCRPAATGGVCDMYKVNSDGQVVTRIPLRYDWSGGGGFFMDYCIIKDVSDSHRAWLAAHHSDQIRANSASAAHGVQYFDEQQVVAMLGRAGESSDVQQVIYGKAVDDRVLRGVKAGLRRDKQKLTERELHEMFGHIGYMPDCKICKLAGGAARRIRSKVDPHKETRPGHTWHMDTITWSHRSEEGCKFFIIIVLRCAATGKFKLISHYLKSNIRDLLRKWIETMRQDPAFHECRYKLVSRINLDNAGEWARDCNKWQELVGELGVECNYSCPDRKESAAAAERNCGIVEVVIKAILYQAALPPSWWQRASGQCEFLLDRLPVASQAANLPPSGDRMRPLEEFTSGAYERRQIDRELSYTLAFGTPALVQTKEKDSSLKPKTRWGIAIGNVKQQVIFLCPYTNSKFRSKSFAAFK